MYVGDVYGSIPYWVIALPFGILFVVAIVAMLLDRRGS